MVLFYSVAMHSGIERSNKSGAKALRSPYIEMFMTLQSLSKKLSFGPVRVAAQNWFRMPRISSALPLITFAALSARSLAV